MKIYTKVGDKGETRLASGEKVSKDNCRVAAYGTMDELNSFLGLMRTQLPAPLQNEFQTLFDLVQNELFVLGSLISSTQPLPKLSLSATLTGQLESEMDRMSLQLPELKNFILPKGPSAVVWSHVLRTVCRRAEREIVRLNNESPVPPEALIFINRLSDFFFVLARFTQKSLGGNDEVWKV